MKKIIATICIALLVILPTTTFASNHLSPQERVVIQAQIEVLKQTLVQLLVQYAAVLQAEEAEPVISVDSDDHVQGSPNADITIVTYLDLDDPFSKNFFTTMQAVQADYDGEELAWVIRHFPLEVLHPNATVIAQASECVANEAGTQAFFAFVDKLFSGRDLNEPVDLANLPLYASEVGVEESFLEMCLAEGQTALAVQQDLTSGRLYDIAGTPTSFVLVGNQSTVINGAQPEEVLRQFLDNVLDQMR